MSRYFTLSEAESLLPRVSQLIHEAVATRAQYQESEAAFQSVLERIAFLGGIVPDRERALSQRMTRDRAAERMKTALDQIQDVGCLVKDLEVGLIDFPTLFRGEEVYLCWKMDEPGIRYWHGVHEGFAGRKSIDQDFLEHHRGDPPQ